MVLHRLKPPYPPKIFSETQNLIFFSPPHLKLYVTYQVCTKCGLGKILVMCEKMKIIFLRFGKKFQVKSNFLKFQFIVFALLLIGSHIECRQRKTHLGTWTPFSSSHRQNVRCTWVRQGMQCTLAARCTKCSN